MEPEERVHRGAYPWHVPGHRVRGVRVVAEAEHGASVTAELRRIERQKQRAVHTRPFRVGGGLPQREVEPVDLSQELALCTARPPTLVDLGLDLVGAVPKLLQHTLIRRVAVCGRDALGIADVLRIGLDQGLALLARSSPLPPGGVVPRPRAGLLRRPQRVAQLVGPDWRYPLRQRGVRHPASVSRRRSLWCRGIAAADQFCVGRGVERQALVGSPCTKAVGSARMIGGDPAHTEVAGELHIALVVDGPAVGGQPLARRDVDEFGIGAQGLDRRTDGGGADGAWPDDGRPTPAARSAVSGAARCTRQMASG